MTVYLLHFHTPLIGKSRKPGGKTQTCQHYLGSTTGELARRIAFHAASTWEELGMPEPTERGTTRCGITRGKGAVVVAAANSAGIAWVVARIWEGDVDLEYALKKRNNNAELCPLCHPRLARFVYQGPVLCNQAWRNQFLMTVPAGELAQLTLLDTVLPF